MSTKLVALLLTACVMTSFATAEAQLPTAEQTLQFKPSQRDVEYDSPLVADVKKCTVQLEQLEGYVGLAVFDPNGVILRRIVDLNKDRSPDMYRYYKNGIEVYRDIDTNFDQKMDQFRWLNSGGSRWGVDRNQDGKIDEWKSLSAEEASRVAINSMIAGDFDLFATVLVTRADLESLGLKDEFAKEMLRQVQEPGAAIRTIMSSGKGLTAQSKWTRLDASMPGLIPADDGKAKTDILVYEGAMAFVETAGQHGIVQVGEMLKIGDVWKLTQVPVPASGNQIVTQGGLLMKPANQAPQIANELSPEMQKLLTELQELDKAAPTPTSSKVQVSKYFADRKRTLGRLVDLSKTEDQRELWMQQLINNAAGSIQAGNKDGVDELNAIEKNLAAKTPKSKLLSYTAWQRIFAEYGLAMQQAQNAKAQQAANKAWLADMAGFVQRFPDADETIQGLVQLAVNAENEGDVKTAEKWYRELRALGIRKNNPGPVARADGALRRLGLNGQLLALKGNDLNGKPIDIASRKGKLTLVVFWASNEPQFAADVPVLRALYEQYHPRGFEVIGVSIDEDPKTVASFLQQNKIVWPTIHDSPDAEKTLAMFYGIPSVPIAFLVDANGAVLTNNITINELKDRIGNEFKGK